MPKLVICVSGDAMLNQYDFSFDILVVCLFGCLLLFILLHAPRFISQNFLDRNNWSRSLYVYHSLNSLNVIYIYIYCVLPYLVLHNTQ